MSRAEAGTTGYSPPEIKDHGSLRTLTADFDAHFVLSVAKFATMTAASGGLSGGPGDGTTASINPDPTFPTDPGPGVGGPDPSVPEGAGPDGVTRGEIEEGGGGDVLPGGPVTGDGGAGGGVPIAEEGVGGEGGGRESLPFTGYPGIAASAAGAAFTTVGVVLRETLRRRGGGD